jgi:hypothetical protein
MLEYAEKLILDPMLINLIPDLEIVKQNRGKRELTTWETDRIEYMYAVCQIHQPQYGYRIDNGQLTIDETVDKIIEIINVDL